MGRSTKQKSAIEEVLKLQDRPLSPLEILSEAKLNVPGLGIATVYRTLKNLSEEGKVVAVELPGQSPRFEISGKTHHHHFHCDVCQKVFEIDGCVGDFSKMIPNGFEANSHEVVIYGKCADCA